MLSHYCSEVLKNAISQRQRGFVECDLTTAVRYCRIGTCYCQEIFLVGKAKRMRTKKNEQEKRKEKKKNDKKNFNKNK